VFLWAKWALWFVHREGSWRLGEGEERVYVFRVFFCGFEFFLIYNYYYFFKISFIGKILFGSEISVF
jgi:hypothetical protein